MESILTALAAYLIVGLSMVIGYLSEIDWVVEKPGRWWRIPAILVFGSIALPFAYLAGEGARQAR